jgi:hypothetical protein
MPLAVSTCGAKTTSGFTSAILAATSSIGAGAKGAFGSFPDRRAMATWVSRAMPPASKICVQR